MFHIKIIRSKTPFIFVYMNKLLIKVWINMSGTYVNRKSLKVFEDAGNWQKCKCLTKQLILNKKQQLCKIL